MSSGLGPLWPDSHAIALGVGIAMTAVSQLLLKTGASGQKSWIGSFFNWRSILGMCMFVMVTFLVVYAMQEIALKTAATWASVTYLLVVCLSRWILRENVGRTKIIGCGLIAAGIVIFSLPF